MEQLARQERVLGDYGGQLASFEWVFSPRGADGRPLQMFNRETGDVDPKVVAYWGDHYDLAHIVTTDWTKSRPLPEGKDPRLRRHRRHVLPRWAPLTNLKRS